MYQDNRIHHCNLGNHNVGRISVGYLYKNHPDSETLFRYRPELDLCHVDVKQE